MLNLGTFEKDAKTGKLTGVLYGVNMVPTKLIFEPEFSERSQRPYYRIYAQSQQATVEAGAAWPKISQTESAKPYIDVKLSSPSLQKPLYGKLFESEVVPNQHHLMWDDAEMLPKTEAKAGNGYSVPASKVRQTAAPSF